MDSNKEHLYRRMLKECQDKASKDTIPVIDYLKTITPKKQYRLQTTRRPHLPKPL